MSRNPSTTPGAKAPARAAWLTAAVVLALATASCTPAPPDGGGGPRPGSSSAAPSTNGAGTPGHVFIVNLENKGYEKVWGAGSAAPYLSATLRKQGVLLSQYYGIAHHSNPNYLAQISGQASNAMTRDDCPTYAPFSQTGVMSPGQVEGTGCVYPASVPTLAGQLSAAGKRWKGYMEDMKTPCRHPGLGAKDASQNAKAGDQYATRHNPFVYFQEITSSPDCKADVVDYSELEGDLRSLDTTPALAYITPNLCNDGHDDPCVDGSPGGLARADAWLAREVPQILDSPAFKQDGMLVITFDESEGNTGGPSGIPGGTAGGRIGALVLSPLIRGGTTSDRLYNHFSLLATVEDAFSLPRLGYAAAAGLNSFGDDVFNARP
jgi:hypothetical protein